MTPIEMNVLTELWVGYRLREYSPTRRHSAEAIDETIAVLRGKGWLDDDVLSTDGANLRDGIEAATDASQGELLEAIGGRADWIIETASRFADRVIAANAFTSDVRKRAAG